MPRKPKGVKPHWTEMEYDARKSPTPREATEEVVPLLRLILESAERGERNLRYVKVRSEEPRPGAWREQREAEAAAQVAAPETLAPRFEYHGRARVLPDGRGIRLRDVHPAYDGAQLEDAVPQGDYVLDAVFRVAAPETEEHKP